MSLIDQHSKDSSVAGANRRVRRRRIRIAILAIFTILLFGLLFIQAAFNTLAWLRPASAGESISLYALSTINFLAFIILLMVLVRNIIKLRRERLERRLGARFKTRLVIFFISLSLLPVLFLFFATTGLINRSIDKWFSLPGNEMLTNAWQIQNAYVDGEQKGLHRTAATMSRLISELGEDRVPDILRAEAENQQLIFAEVFGSHGRLIARRERKSLTGEAADRFESGVSEAGARALAGQAFDTQLNIGETVYLVAAVPLAEPGVGALVIAQEITPDLVGSVKKIREFKGYYESLQGEQKWLRSTSLQALALITLLVLFIAYWLALYVARTVAAPVQQMAEATERIKSGDLSYRAVVVGDDELAALTRSFNEMTGELAENRRRLMQSAGELKEINAALDERRRYIETVLQSLSAGVISLDEHANVTTINEAALRLLRIDHAPVNSFTLEALLPEDQRDELRRIIMRAARLPSVTRDIHITLANQAKLDAALTVTVLSDPSGQARGTVIVLEDLSELIEAQRRAAWSEVARRMAHEIKNPLTPIRLSAERLAKNLLGDDHGNNGGAPPLECLNERQTKLVRECTSMIGAEVATLQRMVDEFSNFARLPGASLELGSLNEVVETTLKLYHERLNGIRLESDLAPGLPSVQIDGEQIKRLLVNLIDNSAEALVNTPDDQRIIVSTRQDPERGTVELIVADTGPGIPAEDRDRIFDPYFSTRKRGTGLGLAIVNRIVTEHHGRIRARENYPRGARFIVELPAIQEIDN